MSLPTTLLQIQPFSVPFNPIQTLNMVSQVFHDFVTPPTPGLWVSNYPLPTSLPFRLLPVLSSPPQAPPSLPSWPSRQPIAENLICIAARGSRGGKGEGPGDLLNQSWKARTGRRGLRVPGWGRWGEGVRDGGAGTEDGGAGRTRTAPSLPPSAHPRVPTSLLPSLRAAFSADPRSSFPGSSGSRGSV